MKLRNIFITGLSLLALTACNDYLEVDAPSKYFPEDVFSDAKAMERAINGVYTTLLDNNTYGDKLLTVLCRNSDVEFKTNTRERGASNKYFSFDCDPDGSEIKKAWESFYHGIELCNLFIEGAEGSPAYDPEEPDANIIQMIGEAKVIRAILYHDLIWTFGDVPFSFDSSNKTKNSIYPIKDRTEILETLINDIKSVADKMKTTAKISEGVERIGQEMAYSMIARLALTAGGYSLRPDGDTYGKMERPVNYLDFYTIAREYAKKVIDSNSHDLRLAYHEVFVNECNNKVVNDDDPIFEIPFGKESTGNIGYIHGPRMDQYQGVTPHPYGKASADSRLNALYRFMFDEDDCRRNYVNQLFRYTATGSEYTAIPENSFTIMNGKWSKLWVNGGLGNATEGNTGINYPYMRYADVLLMCAEADCVLNDGNPTQLAKDCLEKVRERAFRNTNMMKAYMYDQSDFLKTILNERKYEFAGENMRWRDLVRNNMYKEALYYNFFRYYEVAMKATGSHNEDNLRIIAEYDGCEDIERYNKLPDNIYWLATVDNVNDDKTGTYYPVSAFPNTELKVCKFLNPNDGYDYISTTDIKKLANEKGIKSYESKSYLCFVDGQEKLKNEIRFSHSGYIFVELGANNDGIRTFIVRDGREEFIESPSEIDLESKTLPEVRYILPIPRSVIARASGQYVNKYGYK